jgi:hypothetical protein
MFMCPHNNIKITYKEPWYIIGVSQGIKFKPETFPVDVASRSIYCRNENGDVIYIKGESNLLVIYIYNIRKNISRANAPKIR